MHEQDEEGKLFLGRDSGVLEGPEVHGVALVHPAVTELLFVNEAGHL